KVTAVIDPTSVIPLKKGVQEWIKEVINRKKLRLGFMIGTADEELNKEIVRLLSTIQKKGPLTDSYHLPIAKYYPPVEVINDAVILHYKKLNENNSYIQGVQPGDLLIEYVFPKPGRNGRGLDGAPIVIPEPTVKYAGVIQIDDATINSTQDENSIRYYALVSGFVKREKGIFLVAQELHLESVSMKKTGSIEAGTDKEITLTVQQKNLGEDAIGIGVHIDVQTVDISGTVGENTKITACDLNIGAQTHKKSIMDVSGIANIKLHRGNLKAKEANIDVLEGGIIEGDIVRIKKMLGGEIIARKVYVDVLYAHSKIIALESIEINHIEGEGNTLAIDPHSISVYHEKISELVAKVQAKEQLTREYKKELSMKQSVFKEKSAQAKRIQQRIIDAKQNGREPLETDIMTIQQYRAEAGKLQLYAVKIVEEESALSLLREKLDKLYEADLHGVITYHGIYRGNNRVVFIDPRTRQEYSIFPEGKITHIRLDQRGEEKVLLLNAGGE
ncbi:MAG: hypothetical protein Q8K81_08625, partial [Sulfuricurvum sp.]|nr:hypothetical protein [Sulfuricurvum sp.]